MLSAVPPELPGIPPGTVSGIPPDALPGTLSVMVPGVLEHQPHRVRPLASVGKLLLLAEVARGLTGGDLDPGEPFDLLDEDYCGGSGLLTALSARRWTVPDLALLTAAVSDNTATNALIRRVGLDRVNQGRTRWGSSAPGSSTASANPGRRPTRRPSRSAPRRNWPGSRGGSPPTSRGRACCSAGWPGAATAAWCRR